jgi:hypothetical protein
VTETEEETDYQESLRDIVDRCQEMVMRPMMDWRAAEIVSYPDTASLATDALCVVISAILCTESVYWLGEQITDRHEEFTDLAVDQVAKTVKLMLKDKDFPRGQLN